MPTWLKIVLGALFALIIIAGLTFWHLKVVYQSWVASTSKGEPAFDRELLETYGDMIIAELTRKDVTLAIVSRSGQPRKDLPKGISYTHSAFWVSAHIITSDGTETPNYAVYNLYHNDPDRLSSRLEMDAAADFLQLTREHDVGIIIPDAKTQADLKAYIQSEKYDDMHQTAYSLISNPFDLRFQNCNEFMLDVMASMVWETGDRAGIKHRLKEVLTPAEIKASPIRRILGPRIDERLIMADQGDKIVTTTRQTLRHFLELTGSLQEDYVLELGSASK